MGTWGEGGMNGSEALSALRDELRGLTEVRREVGPVPLDTFFKEAAALARTVGVPEVRERLLAVGIEARELDKLPVALRAAQEAQAAWMVVKGRSYSNTLVELIAQAYRERGDLLAVARFHLRSDRTKVETLGAIAEGNGLDDLIQDLFALWHLIEQNADAFARDRTFDAPARAQGARQLAERLQQTQTEELFDTLQRGLRDQRDRAYTLLSRLVREIRITGRYAFRGDPTMMSRFSSAYAIARGRKRRRTARMDQEEGTPANRIAPADPSPTEG
jgi:hypothetical protein